MIMQFAFQNRAYWLGIRLLSQRYVNATQSYVPSYDLDILNIDTDWIHLKLKRNFNMDPFCVLNLYQAKERVKTSYTKNRNVVTGGYVAKEGNGYQPYTIKWNVHVHV